MKKRKEEKTSAKNMPKSAEDKKKSAEDETTKLLQRIRKNQYRI